jgi:hypothetical protein
VKFSDAEQIEAHHVWFLDTTDPVLRGGHISPVRHLAISGNLQISRTTTWDDIQLASVGIVQIDRNRKHCTCRSTGLIHTVITLNILPAYEEASSPGLALLGAELRSSICRPCMESLFANLHTALKTAAVVYISRRLNNKGDTESLSCFVAPERHD